LQAKSRLDGLAYLPMIDIDMSAPDRELKKGAAELLVLSVLKARAPARL